MQEARIILPVLDNAGFELHNAHAFIENALVRHWGGCTIFEGKGIWKDDASGTKYREAVYIYDVAMESNPIARDVLKAVAIHACRMASQECVYVRHANHEVEFVSHKGK